METTMSNETNSMSGMMKNSYFGDFTTPEEKKECAITGLIKNHINLIDEEMEEADKNFSRAYHNERYSNATYEADEKCKMLKAQKTILMKVQRDIEDILTPNQPVMSMSA